MTGYEDYEKTDPGSWSQEQKVLGEGGQTRDHLGAGQQGKDEAGDLGGAYLTLSPTSTMSQHQHQPSHTHLPLSHWVQCPQGLQRTVPWSSVCLCHKLLPALKGISLLLCCCPPGAHMVVSHTHTSLTS